MELTPALKEKVEKAIQAALKDVKPRPAVDRLLAARVTGKWARRSCVRDQTVSLLHLLRCISWFSP